MIAIGDMIWNYEPVLLTWLLASMLSKRTVRHAYKRAHKFLTRSYAHYVQESQHSSVGTDLQQLWDWQSRQRFCSTHRLLVYWAFKLCARFLWRFNVSDEGNTGGKTALRDKQSRQKLGNHTMPTKWIKAAQPRIALSSAYSEAPAIASELLDRCNVVAEDGRAQEDSREIEALDAIGDLLKTWRIQQQLTRATLAEQLGMTSEQLLFLETGMSMSHDISIDQLKRLQEMLANSVQSGELTCLLQEYAQVHSLPEETFTTLNASAFLACSKYTTVVN